MDAYPARHLYVDTMLYVRSHWPAPSCLILLARLLHDLLGPPDTLYDLQIRG